MANLLLVTINDARYGIWEEALAAVRGALPLHHIPLSPPVIAGITVLDDRSAVIADLSACLGCPPMNDAQSGSFLVIDFHEKIAGFGVEGPVDRVEHSAEQVFGLPEGVRTEVVDSCAVLNNSVVPIINIRALHERLKQGRLDMPQAETAGSAPRSGASGSPFPVRVFTLGGERFCVNAGGTSFETISRERIAALPVKNGWLAGITVHDHSVLPLIRLDAFLGREAQSDRRGVVIVGSGGRRYGLLVDKDLGIIEQQDLRISVLPELVRRSWMRSAAVNSGTVYPLIDVDMITSVPTAHGELETHRSFSPSPEFMGRFRKSEVDIVEFSLLGATHAIPKTEAGDDLQLLPVTAIPHSIEIVIGVADLCGELLPVLDLAAVFGRSSAVKSDWRMIRITNGDFDALIVTEEVRGDRRLSLEDQKQLPLALPHQVLYGCYLDGGVVRLIMNVQALAVHFEKAAVRELVTSLSAQMDAPVVKSGSVSTKTAPTVIPEAVSQVSSTVSEPVSVPAGSTPAGPRSVVPADHRNAVAAIEEERRQTANELERLAAEKVRAEEQERFEAEQRLKEEESRQRDAEQKRLQKEQEARQKSLDEQLVEEERIRKQAEEDARLQAEEDAREQEREAARRAAAEAALKRPEEEGWGKESPERAPIIDSPMQESPVPEEQTVQHHTSAEGNKWYRWTIAAALAAVLFLIIYFISGTDKRSEPPVQSKKEVPAAVQEKASVPEKLPPLYLTVPPERIVPAQNIYTVVKGDTLWGIAKRFTGDPLNYPRVARDNSIATPDLIFPGQRIRLVQAEH